ncbi:hypothetical protein [Nocardia veterana]|uniref:Uncharacterized protein n=1 Tax=Nocardia veterana TaxID=132249 RepID=A0A7X6RH00_9NOCA|nr:hypothetical protein [Nocardia veterana]NKY85657.1 hypothetical protein [Nocardia veterana]
MNDERKRVLHLVTAAAHDRGYACELVRPECVLLSGTTVFTLRLNVIRHRMRMNPPDRWPQLVADAIDDVVVAAETEREHPLDYSDFSVMRTLVRTRLYGTASVGGNGVRRTVAPGLIQRVIIDGLHTTVPVTYEMLARWPIGEWELFELAEHNVRVDGGVDIAWDFLDDLRRIRDLPPAALLSGPEYLTAHIRHLGDHPVTGPEGAVLVAPSAVAVYVCPVVGPEVARAVDLLAVLAHTLHSDDPLAINTNVYWWRSGALELAARTFRRDDTTVIRYTDTYVRRTTAGQHGKPLGPSGFRDPS